MKYDPLTPGDLNWTATVRLYASGGDGHDTDTAPDPDGGFDYQTVPDAFFPGRGVDAGRGGVNSG